MTAKSPVQRIDHRYDECGVEGVTLVGLPMGEWHGEPYLEIANIKALHRVLYDAVARRAGRFAPQHLRFVRVGLRKTQGELASLIGRDLQTVGRWERGEGPIDKAAEIVIRRMTLEHAGVGALPSVEDLAELIAAPESGAGIRIDASDPDNYRLMGSTGAVIAFRPAKKSVTPQVVSPMELAMAAARKTRAGGAVSVQPDKPAPRPRKTHFLGSLIGPNGKARLAREGEGVFVDLPSGPKVGQLFLGDKPFTLTPGSRSRRYVVSDLKVGDAQAFLLRQSRDPAAYPADWR